MRMKRQKTTDNSSNLRFISFAKRHKIWTIIGLLATIALVLTSIDYYHVYEAYKKRLTEKDFAAISEMAESVIKNTGGAEIIKSDDCSYERPEIYADLHLYCSVRMISYIPYESDDNALRVARTLEREMSVHGDMFTHSENFYRQPGNESAQFFVDLKTPLADKQCSFSIYTNDRAKDAVLFAPKRMEDNLIAISFNCSAQSRGEYFPVTYRQG